MNAQSKYTKSDQCILSPRAKHAKKFNRYKLIK